MITGIRATLWKYKYRKDHTFYATNSGGSIIMDDDETDEKPRGRVRRPIRQPINIANLNRRFPRRRTFQSTGLRNMLVTVA